MQDQLKKALQLHVTPKTSVDTATIADKIVNMFDEMIQVALKPLQLGTQHEAASVGSILSSRSICAE